jgi:hypothetical protein
MSERVSLRVLVFLFVVCAQPPTVMADPVRITGYDITNTPISGTGIWAHTYDGSITNSGTINGVQLADYRGGSGTLTDGVIGRSHLETQLLIPEANPVITLYFDALYSLNTIFLFGGEFGPNVIPGALEKGVTVTAGGRSVQVDATPFGRLNPATGLPYNDILDLGVTPLGSMLIDRVVLSGFQSAYQELDLHHWFSLTEISAEGDVAPVPEPATLTLLGVGLAAAGWRARRRRQPASA